MANDVPAPGMRYFAMYDGTTPIAFYHEAIHGARLIPRMVMQGGQSMTEFPTTTWEYVANPDCRIPSEAKEISEADYKAWLETK